MEANLSQAGRIGKKSFFSKKKRKKNAIKKIFNNNKKSSRGPHWIRSRAACIT